MIKLNLLFAVASMTLSSLAQADIIKCTFTEPFVSVEYSTTTNELKTNGLGLGENGEDLVTVEKNVSFQIKGPGQFELLSKTKKLVMTLNLNFEGSNGMSDEIYPYDAQFDAMNLRGGCTSNFLKTKLPEGGVK